MTVSAGGTHANECRDGAGTIGCKANLLGSNYMLAVPASSWPPLVTVLCDACIARRRLSELPPERVGSMCPMTRKERAGFFQVARRPPMRAVPRALDVRK